MEFSGNEILEIWTMFSNFFLCSPDIKKCHPVCGKPVGMCEHGSQLFQEFCNNLNKLGFVKHYGSGSEQEGCIQCHDAFLDYLLLFKHLP